SATVRQPQVLLNWIQQGAALQVTAASLLGGFGRSAERAAWDWLGHGLVALIATDAHDTSTRRHCLLEAIEAITRRLSHVIARTVCVDNPARLLSGEPLLGRTITMKAGA